MREPRDAIHTKPTHPWALVQWRYRAMRLAFCTAFLVGPEGLISVTARLRNPHDGSWSRKSVTIPGRAVLRLWRRRPALTEVVRVKREIRRRGAGGSTVAGSTWRPLPKSGPARSDATESPEKKEA